jgi:hypothetical protein
MLKVVTAYEANLSGVLFPLSYYDIIESREVRVYVQPVYKREKVFDGRK